MSIEREPRERPILFSAPMVRAILAGTKTQTRRVVDIGKVKQPVTWVGWNENGSDGPGWYAQDVLGPSSAGPAELCEETKLTARYGGPGDVLWGKETWRVFGGPEYEYQRDPASVQYRADEVAFEQKEWRPSIFMPKWASRIRQTLTEVRIQRVTDISEEDAIAEGVMSLSEEEVAACARKLEPRTFTRGPAVARYEVLWDALNSKRPGCAWRDAPWVWAISFKVVRQ